MRAALGVLALTMGFAWPGQAERLVGDLTRASTPRDKRDALRLVGTLDELPREAVLPFTRDPDPSVRAEANRLLGLEPEHPPDTRALIVRLDDDALEVRIAAAQALAGRETTALLAYSEAALPELRAAVIDALGHDATAEVERVLARALEDRDTDVVLAAMRGYARHPELARPARLHTLAHGAHPQLAWAARALLRPRSWQDPLWLVVLERTTREDPIDALEVLLPEGETRATEPLRLWLARAPKAIGPRIEALIARSLQTSAAGDKHAPHVAH